MFVRDTRRFVLSFRVAIASAPLQIYSSALIFAPTSSIVRKTFEPICAGWITTKPSVQSEWNARLQTLEGHRESIDSIAFSPDGTRLASASKRDGSVRIWDRATGAYLKALDSGADTNGYCRMSLVFSPDSSQLALASERLLEMWNLNTSDCLITLTHDLDWPSMTFSPSGKQLILSNDVWEDNHFWIYDLATSTWLQKGNYYPDLGEPAVYKLNTSDADMITKIRNPITGLCLQLCSNHPLDIVVFSPDGVKVALSADTDDCVIYILEIATGTCLQRLEERERGYSGLMFSPDNTQLVTAFADGSHQIWDLATGICLYDFDIISIYSRPYPYLLSTAFSPDGAEMAFAKGNIIEIFDPALGATRFFGGQSIYSVTYSSDSTLFALVSDYTIQVWNSAARISLGELPYHGQYIQQVAFSRDNTQLAVSTRHPGLQVKVWDSTITTCRCTFDLSRDPADMNSMAFSFSGTRLACAFSSGVCIHIEIWNVTNGMRVSRLDTTLSQPCVEFSSDDRRLGSVSTDGTIQIWDLTTGTCLTTLETNNNIERWDEGEMTTLQRLQRQCFAAKVLQNQDAIYNAIHDFDLSSDRSWLLRRGEPFLWLPPDYRYFWDMAFSGEHVAIVHGARRPLFFRFALSRLDNEMASLCI